MLLLIAGRGGTENHIEDMVRDPSDIDMTLYDLKSKSNESFLRWPFRQRPQTCECRDYSCSCCAGMSIKAFNFNRKREYLPVCPLKLEQQISLFLFGSVHQFPVRSKSNTNVDECHVERQPVV